MTQTHARHDSRSLAAGTAARPASYAPRSLAPPGTAGAHTPYALAPHDAAWGLLTIVLSAAMFVLTPVLAVLRKLDVLSIGWGWVFLPAFLCVAVVMLHGVAELVRALRSGEQPRQQ